MCRVRVPTLPWECHWETGLLVSIPTRALLPVTSVVATRSLPVLHSSLVPSQLGKVGHPFCFPPCGPQSSLGHSGSQGRGLTGEDAYHVTSAVPDDRLQL